MKLVLQNVGRIASAEIDIRPLTVFVGPNNTNKSWAAYATWAVARWFTSQPGRSSYRAEPDAGEWFDLGALGQKSTFDWPFELDRAMVRPTGGPKCVSIDNPLEDALGSTWPKREALASLFLDPADLEEGLASRASVDVVNLEEGAFRIRLQDASGRVIASYVDVEESGAAAISFAADALFPRLFGRLVSMPIERILPPTGLGTREGGFAARFDEWLHEALLVNTVGMPDLALRLERVLGVRVAEDSGGVRIRAGDVDLGLHESASMVRSLTPLVLYLRKLARPWDWVFIDEPEMNAHPKAQIAIAEVIAMMVNRGIRVLVTTHSPYFVDHLSNLMGASQLPDRAQRDLAARLELASIDALLPSSSVAAYQFEVRDDAVEVTDILDRELAAVDIATFADQTDRLGMLDGKVRELRHATRR